MGELVVYTYDWVPEPPRGHVRDIRLRWALEEAGLPYRVASVPFENRGSDHLAHQPFAQVPWLTDGDLTIFETGAILLHLGTLSPVLLPEDPNARNSAIEWLFAGLNSVEMASLPWSLLAFAKAREDTKAWEIFDNFLTLRLDRLEPVLSGKTWLAGDFSIADILMADVLRLVERFGRLENHPAARAYIARATARPAFKKAHADQMAHFAAADRRR